MNKIKDIEQEKNIRIKRASEKQFLASDPRENVWVAASAGTGKTKVLTDRVLRLLLDGNSPEKLLCLTFTKAAAAEMSNRIALKLSLWATLDNEKLKQEIISISGNFPKDEKKGDKLIKKARRLFAVLLETKGGIKIQTIHSFCQYVLKSFPLEARISPNFEVLDDRRATELLNQAKMVVFQKANENKKLQEAINFITKATSESSFFSLLDDLIKKKNKLIKLEKKYSNLESIISNTAKALKVSKDQTVEQTIEKACKNTNFDYETLFEISQNIQEKSFSRNKNPEAFYKFIKAKDIKTRIEIFDDYKSCFLTKNNKPKAAFLKKEVKEDFYHQAMADEADRLINILDEIKSVKILQASKALVTISFHLIKEYNKYKRKNLVLDYDDLIIKTKNLFEDKQTAPWVLYKLDGGIDHLLVDEAQDTSLEQWAVIKAILEEFFSGLGAVEKNRTIFVVGDKKQSIYSFQGAEPKEFEKTKNILKEKTSAIKRPIKDVALNTSFRSTEAILHLVNETFKLDLAKKGVVAKGEDITHFSSRVGDAGLVELWQTIRPKKTDQQNVWKPPVERVAGDSPQSRTAYFIARKIYQLIKNNEILLSKARAIEPKDFMILVRTRTPFINDLVRELKNLDIEVAGVDKLFLGDQIAIMDLIALGEFLLLPEDDLNLACVLKSPIFELSEEELFEISYNRKNKSLFESLKKHAKDSENKNYNQIYQTLKNLLSMTDRIRPFELFSYILINLNAKKNLIKRLGLEVCDPIDEFLNLVLSYEKNHTPSLESFLVWFNKDKIEIKRELEQADKKNAVRIMTAHGAKGLQAPIVFLPHTLQKKAKNKTPNILFDENDLLFWGISTKNFNQYLEELKEKHILEEEEEYKRLLYVATTRAEDRLYITGWENKNKPDPDCWYELLGSAMDKIASYKSAPFAEIKDYGKYPKHILSYETKQLIKPKKQESTKKEEPKIFFPQWLKEPPAEEPQPPKPLTPSKPEEEPALNSPLGKDMNFKYKRGNLIHKMLEILPEINKEQRRDAATKFLQKFAFDLKEEKRIELIDETINVLEHKYFADLFEKGSKAEVPIVGLVDGKVLSAIVDRLVIKEDKVLIVDYKTNRPPPTEPKDIPKIYINQLSLYKKALTKLYPDKKIVCALLWTDIPLLMAVPDDLLV